MTAAKAPDKVDAAIAAATPPEVPNVTFEIHLSSGRVAGLFVPLNMTPQEAIDLIGYIAVQVPKQLVEAALRAQGVKTIATPRGPHLVRPT